MPSNDTNKFSFTISVDKNLKINSWNEELERMYGKSFAEVQAVPYYEVIPRIQKGGKDIVKEVLRDGKPITVEGFHIACFWGESKAVFHVTPLKDKTGKLNGAIIKIDVYTACTLCKKLKQSQKLLDIGKIAGSFAHGVRNPLNAIKGAVVYLRERYANDKKFLEFTKIIEEEIARLDSFIAKFLSTSISDKEFFETDVNAVIKKIETITSLQARTYRIKTLFDYGSVSPVAINGFHLEHAVLNVINNAIEAMPSGGKLSVKTQPEIRTGTKFASILISDTGRGMLIGKGDEITIPSKVKGKGFGLFITREILQSSGGHLEIRSERGVGTTVKLSVPAK